MKKGFTLIELMVVVVIIGILAAVAVPKLFGMIAKSKASEVGPAAGTYVKMQQAYISENGTVLGNYKVIGYSTPGEGNQTTNFDYTENDQSWDKNTVALSTTDIDNAWQAKSRVKLNDCAESSVWSVSVKASSTNAGEATFTAKVPSDDCEALTPSFTKIGK